MSLHELPLEVSFTIEDPKIISVNDQYIHPVRKTKSGRYVSYFAKSPYLKEVQSFYEDSLKDLISDNDIEKFKSFVENDKDNGIQLYIILGIPSSDIRENDASNYIKSIEDCIVSRTGIDDSMNYRVIVEKRKYDNEEGKWILKVVLSKTTLVAF